MRGLGLWILQLGSRAGLGLGRRTVGICMCEVGMWDVCGGLCECCSDVYRPRTCVSLSLPLSMSPSLLILLPMSIQSVAMGLRVCVCLHVNSCMSLYVPVNVFKPRLVLDPRMFVRLLVLHGQCHQVLVLLVCLLPPLKRMHRCAALRTYTI